MDVIEKADLSNRNTLRLSSVCAKLYIPETIEDLATIYRECVNPYILGNGSNLLMKEYIETPVIDTTRINKTIQYENDIVTCGCSVRIQQLIRYCQNIELGGLEFLFSVPALVGGAVCMNAGTGKSSGKAIAQFIQEVRVFDGQKILRLSHNDCHFGYRNSIFQSNHYFIYEVDLKLTHLSKDDIEKRIQERMKWVKQLQDNKYPNAGTTFNKSSKRINKMLMGLRFKGAAYSNKTPNWIINLGNGKYSEIKFLLRISKFLHLIVFSKAKQEIIDWNK